MRALQRTWNYLFKKYLMPWWIFFVDTHMKVLHKHKKSKLYAIPSSGYVPWIGTFCLDYLEGVTQTLKNYKLHVIPSYGYLIYSLGWNIVFKLSWGYCIIYLKKSKMCVISLHLGTLFMHGGMFLIVMKVLCKPWKHTMNIHYFYESIELGDMM
jgi:hypothetical protein